MAAASAPGPSDDLVDEALRKLKEGAFESPRANRRDKRKKDTSTTMTSSGLSNVTTLESMGDLGTSVSSAGNVGVGGEEIGTTAQNLLAMLKGDGVSSFFCLPSAIFLSNYLML